MRSTIKTAVKALFAVLILIATALADDHQFKTRLITSATLTINVKDGVFIVIRNFTQDKLVAGQSRGVIEAGLPPPSPTPTPIPTATATPTSTDLTATKADNAGGHATFPNSWTWTIHIANGGATAASFASGQTILSDNLPNTNISYGSPQVINSNGITTISATINCTISGTDDLTCTVSGTSVTINPGGSFDVSFSATPSATGTFTNPRTGGGCSVDPGNAVSESNESNNTCADTVISGTPTPTPTPTPTATPIKAPILTAALLSPPPAEFIKPIIIAGPATLTIDPVPGATLAITYRKFLQPIQPTASATATVASTSAPVTSSSLSTLPAGTTTRSVSVIDNGDDDGIEWSTPSRKQRMSPTATPTPTPAPSVSSASPTPTPTIIPLPTPTLTP